MSASARNLATAYTVVESARRALGTECAHRTIVDIGIG